jgi:transcriptional regulator with XRE-family HTH domain
MPARERAADRGSRTGARVVRDIGEEIRRARVGAGISQGVVGHAVGLSHATISRLERGLLAGTSVRTLARVCAVVGLEVSVRAYPVASPFRDHAHVEVLRRFRALLHGTIAVASEAPFPRHGDLRTWDALLGAEGARAGVEVETRPRDGQELVRRMTLKRRDGGVDVLILVLPDTRSNRAFIRANDEALRSVFPGNPRVAINGLRSGQLPTEDVLILL